MIGSLLKAADWARHQARLRSGNPDHALGRRGEDLAHRFLRRLSYTIVARNYRLTSGAAEIDIIARDGMTLVFIEVKTRSSDEYGSPDRAVGLEKQRHMLRAAIEYARRAEVEWHQVRFDIINVVATEPPAITHLQDVLPLRQ